jgi:hypothetical protein
MEMIRSLGGPSWDNGPLPALGAAEGSHCVPKACKISVLTLAKKLKIPLLPLIVGVWWRAL